ncbi:NrdR family transcriptional regulator [Caldimicrobium thiodismutans]|jgi:transcriptional repressor NrdR|uniref:Transcriptional repressor NrdR n=1 Tax=Caldimicrobium thiodismutans TaxID=1653476 RepID=A0A0U5ALU2_9BACT|nr:transcriptional regulator NrdR [Caldimicrobium thiodismutans]BAU22980.1 NrdR family transcriptional regulator [Caldimicrobium thiodismutans]
MKCPKCKEPETRVIDSRIIEDGFTIRRRRECLKCGYRFTTYEKLELDIVIVKKDGRREPYSREKLLSGIRKACHKRPISEETIKAFVNELELDLIQRGEREIPASFLGERVMSVLKKWDKVAYIRFASVYKDFQDVDEFLHSIKELSNE